MKPSLQQTASNEDDHGDDNDSFQPPFLITLSSYDTSSEGETDPSLVGPLHGEVRRRTPLAPLAVLFLVGSRRRCR